MSTKFYAFGIYDDELVNFILKELAFIRTCDDGGGIAFAYQNILDALHCATDNVVDGIPSFVDENGGV